MTTTERSNSAIRGPRHALVVFLSAIAIVSMTGIPVPANGKGHHGPEGTVWVVNRDRGELAVFDARTGDVIAIRRGGGRGPRHLHFRAGPQGLHHRRGAQPGHDSGYQDIGHGVDRGGAAAAPRRAEPRRTHDLRQPGVSHQHGWAARPNTRPSTPTASRSRSRPTSNNPKARSHGLYPSHGGKTLYVAHDLGDEVTGIDVDAGTSTSQHHGDRESGGSRPDAVRPLALGVVARRRHGEADRPRHDPAVTGSVTSAFNPRSDPSRSCSRRPSARWSSACVRARPPLPSSIRAPQPHRHAPDRRARHVRRSGRDDPRWPLRLRHVRRRHARHGRRGSH